MQHEITAITRLRLMRYVGPETDWQPEFALTSRGGELVLKNVGVGEILTFVSTKAAVNYAREHNATVEWEMSWGV